MLWHIPAIVSVVTVSIATLLQRVLMRENKSDPIGYAIIFQFLLGFIALLFALLFGKFIFPPLAKMPLRFIISGFLWTGSTVFSFNAIKRLGAGEVTVLISSASLISIILGILFLHETLRLSLIIGTILILGAIWIIFSEKLSFSSRKGVLFALLASFCSGIAVVNDAVILRFYEAFSYTAVSSFLPGIILVLIFPRNMKRVVPVLNINFVFTMTVFCLFFTIQAIAYYLAFQNGAPVSQLSPLIRSSVVLTVILAAIFLKERSHLPRKFIAAVMMTIGVILLG